jgi:hypothetical protein
VRVRAVAFRSAPHSVATDKCPDGQASGCDSRQKGGGVNRSGAFGAYMTGVWRSSAVVNAETVRSVAQMLAQRRSRQQLHHDIGAAVGQQRRIVRVSVYTNSSRAGKNGCQRERVQRCVFTARYVRYRTYAHRNVSNDAACFANFSKPIVPN